MVRAKLIEYSFFRPHLKVSKASRGRKIQNLGYDGLPWSTLRSFGCVNCVWVWQMQSYTPKFLETFTLNIFPNSQNKSHLHDISYFTFCSPFCICSYFAYCSTLMIFLDKNRCSFLRSVHLGGGLCGNLENRTYFLFFNLLLYFQIRSLFLLKFTFARFYLVDYLVIA